MRQRHAHHAQTLVARLSPAFPRLAPTGRSEALAYGQKTHTASHPKMWSASHRGTGSALQLAKPRGASVSRLTHSVASQVFDALRERGTAPSVSLGPILCLKTADPLAITVGRDDNGFPGAPYRRHPEILLIEPIPPKPSSSWRKRGTPTASRPVICGAMRRPVSTPKRSAPTCTRSASRRSCDRSSAPDS
jgi:hypothetical protein